jgi:beta-lactam-binding protein with PASTA domain
MNLMVVAIIVIVLGVIVGNIMLLKHTAKFSMKNINRDPIEDAKERLNARKLADESNDDASSSIESSDFEPNSPESPREEPNKKD